MQERSIGEKIREHRLKKGMTQDALAAELHVSSQAVSKWEKGQTMPDISLLLPLSRLLEIGVDDLLGGDRRAELERAWQKAVCLGEELSLLVAEDALKEFPDDETFLYRRACDEYFIATKEGKTTGGSLRYLREAEQHFWELHRKYPENDSYTAFLADVYVALGNKDRALDLLYTVKDKDYKDRKIAKCLGGDEEAKYKQEKLNRSTTDLFYLLLSYNTRDSINAAYGLLDVMMKEGKALRGSLVSDLYVKDAYLYLDEGNVDAYAEKLTKAYEALLSYMDLTREPVADPDPLFDHLEHKREDAASLNAFLLDVWGSKKMAHPATLPLRRRVAEEQLHYYHLHKHEWLAYYQFCKRYICKEGYQDFSVCFHTTEQEEREDMYYYATRRSHRAIEGMFEYFKNEVERLVGGGKMSGFLAGSMNNIVAYCNCGAKEKYTRLPVPEGYTEISGGAKIFSIAEILVADNIKNCGVEEKLLSTALAWAKKDGFTHAEAYLLERMIFPGDDLDFDALVALYQKLGFNVVYDVTEMGRRGYVLRKKL